MLWNHLKFIYDLPLEYYWRIMQYMNLLYLRNSSFILKIRNHWRSVLRFRWKMKCAKTMKTKTGVTVFCSNCLGGIIYNTLGMRFDSPTINMYIKPCDFIRFLKEYPVYLEAERFELQEMGKYPVVRCYKYNSEEYITLFCVHYKSVEEVAEKWRERSKRVTKDIRVIMAQRDGCTNEDLMEFDKLPFKKVCFTCKPYPKYNWAICVKSDKQNPNSGEVIDLTKYVSWYSGRRLIDNFDYINFIKGNNVKINKELYI